MQDQGFSVAELLIAVFISGLIAAGAFEIILQSKRISVSSENTMWIEIRRTEFQNFLRSDAGWNAVIANNPQMNCFSSDTGCASTSGPQPLKLPTSDGVVLDGTNPATGLTANGLYCTGFTPSGDSSACPVGLSLTWEALCDSSACLHPQPKITVAFSKKEANQSLKQMPSYTLLFFRDAKLDSLNVVCNGMGGTLAGTSCSIPALNTLCSPSTGQFASGFDASGLVMCGPPSAGSCPAGQIATGFNADGSIQCAGGCP